MITIKNTFDAPIEKLWSALTSKEEMKLWYFSLDDFKAEPGFRFSFAGQGHKGEQYIHLCKVTEVIPFRKLQYSWEYKNYPGISLLTFSLTDLNRKTNLSLTHEGIETFPADNPDFSRESFEQGWKYIVQTSLHDYLTTIQQ